ncbi:hypothetical protein L208DRAFT_1389782 [Tricholoma matsutake]|nr:hypothetical protein L208DRAFT_1394245 [Tricholoma matsutake 945]KAF8237229.1 hypothetical protein L208DRAFT_1389782 [Tricholoma matsutake 945]
MIILVDSASPYKQLRMYVRFRGSTQRPLARLGAFPVLAISLHSLALPAIINPFFI